MNVTEAVSNLVKDENGDLLTDSYKMWNRWKNYSSQLLDVLNVSDAKQAEVHTVESLTHNPSPF
jgi:hypothetical protein